MGRTINYNRYYVIMTNLLAFADATSWQGVIITAITTVAILFFTLFAKSIFSIFKAGVNYKSKFVTKEEFDELKAENEKFRAELRESFKVTRAEIERTTLSTSKAIIDREMKHLTVIDEKMDKFNDSYIQFSATSKWMEERYNELNVLSDEVLELKKRMNKYEMADESNTTRRTMR